MITIFAINNRLKFFGSKETPNTVSELLDGINTVVFTEQETLQVTGRTRDDVSELLDRIEQIDQRDDDVPVDLPPASYHKKLTT